MAERIQWKETTMTVGESWNEKYGFQRRAFQAFSVPDITLGLVFIYYLLSAPILFAQVTPSGKMTPFQNFLESPPAIYELSATITSSEQNPANSPATACRYCWLRCQKEDFVILCSDKTNSVLQGFTNQKGGNPTGCGKFGNDYWVFWGDSRAVGITQWHGSLSNGPVALQKQFSKLLGIRNELLTLGCKMVQPGTFHWTTNWSHISMPNEDSEIDAELVCAPNGIVNQMRYGLQPSGSRAHGSLPPSYWANEYLFNDQLPAPIPARILRTWGPASRRIPLDAIDIHKVRFVDNQLTAADFTPSNFLSDAIITDRKYVERNAQTTPNHFLFLIMSIAIIPPLAVAFYAMRTNQTKIK